MADHLLLAEVKEQILKMEDILARQLAKLAVFQNEDGIVSIEAARERAQLQDIRIVLNDLHDRRHRLERQVAAAKTASKGLKNWREALYRVPPVGE